MIGGLSQPQPPLARETAQILGAGSYRLADAGCCGSLIGAAVVPLLGREADRLYRYPSFDGRSRLCFGASPILFTRRPLLTCSARLVPDRRSFAHAMVDIGPVGGTGLGVGALCLGPTQRSHNRKGCQLCRLPNGSRAPYAPSHLLLAATRRLSRALSGRGLARARLSFWTATRSRALLSAALPMSSIASATRRAADSAAGVNPRNIPSRHVNHRAARRSGGFLLSEDLSPQGSCPRDQEPEGT
jgi:hypothetical protein